MNITLESQFLQLELDDTDIRLDQYIEEQSENWSESRKDMCKKKRGAPFKGLVSDFNEEKFKV